MMGAAMPGRDDANAHPAAGQEPAAPYMTLAEAAAATGKHPEALRGKARRGSIPAIRGNDGTWRIQVPIDRPNGQPPHDLRPDVEDLQATVGRLNEQFARLEAGRVDAIARAEAEGDRNAAGAEPAALREVLARAEARADRLEAALAEARKPVLVRLLEALLRR